MVNQTNQTASLQIRWMISRDRPHVLEIERTSFKQPWSEDDLLVCLRQKTVIGMVAESPADDVVGYMIYELLNTELISRVLSSLKQSRFCVACPSEFNSQAHAFFSSAGFRATGVMRGLCRHNGEPCDAYRFVFQYPGLPRGGAA